MIAHNKTLAAQLCNEFREFFPTHAVEYFVSYYDYYQPEAYLPSSDTYIEKDSSRNDDIDRLRHAATSSLLRRRDVVIVASVSCIYGLGSPSEYEEQLVTVQTGADYSARPAAARARRHPVPPQRRRARAAAASARAATSSRCSRPTPRPRTASRCSATRSSRSRTSIRSRGEVYAREDEITIYPGDALRDDAADDRARRCGRSARSSSDTSREFEEQGKLLEAHRLRQRTEYDLEMMQELGYCNGIENYSRVLDGRAPGQAPFTLLDYFPGDFLVMVDESHQTVPQIGGMYEGDRSRKEALVAHGFRLPLAMDNRPLRFDEFLERVPQAIFVSATPGPYEMRVSSRVVEQIIRPTGLVDPEVEVRPTRHQIDDLLAEIRLREEAGERVLVTTLTKKMAEDLTDYLIESGVRARYLHSEIDTLERIQIIRQLRLGEYDVLVGVNLLREGLDLPEVSLVAILDADKEGFLRGHTALIQTIGRAARHVNGRVVMYADKRTAGDRGGDRRDRRAAARSSSRTTRSTASRRPRSCAACPTSSSCSRSATRRTSRRRRRASGKVEGMTREEIEELVVTLEQEMLAAAEELRFEYAAKLRDELKVASARAARDRRASHSRMCAFQRISA